MPFGLELLKPGRVGRGRRVGAIVLCEKCWAALRNPGRHDEGPE